MNNERNKNQKDGSVNRRDPPLFHLLSVQKGVQDVFEELR